MNILLYRWRAYHYQDVAAALTYAGHTLDTICYDIMDEKKTAEFFDLMETYLKKRSYDMVFSINYFSVISDVCEQYQVPYAAWNCDGMLISMYHRSVFHACNYIFSFDMAEVEKFRAMGVKHIYYLPLAADTNRLDRVIAAHKNRGKEMAAIAFVGNLYERNRYDSIEHRLPEYLRGYLEASLWAQLQVSGGNLLLPMLTEDILLQLSDYFCLEKEEASFADLGLIFASTVLGFKAANMEREYLLYALSLAYPVDVYTNSRTDPSWKIKCLGQADYWEEMPLIFHHSSINLNMTIPNIVDGTPLRVWDILACGGFCMTTYRPDLLRHFKQGEELVIFEGKDDLLQKTEYYLSHETERRRIAQQGYEKVKKQHSYTMRLQEMFRILTQEGVCGMS